MNSGVKSDNMTKSIICCTPMKKEEIIKAADKPRQTTQTMQAYGGPESRSVFTRGARYIQVFIYNLKPKVDLSRSSKWQNNSVTVNLRGHQSET